MLRMREEAEELLGRLMLLGLKAWSAGDVALSEVCRRAETDLRIWLERRLT